jgi:hypothetical protein
MLGRIEAPDVLGLFSGRIAQNSQVYLQLNTQTREKYLVAQT